jgi:hypothetical protein
MIFDASSVPLIVRPAPIIKVEALVSVAFERTDLAKMTAFLLDFGFKEQAAEVGGRRFLRGYGTQPYCVELIPSARDGFVGFTFAAATAGDLHTLASAHGVPVEPANEPRRAQKYFYRCQNWQPSRG